MIGEIRHLIKKEILLEWRQKYAFLGVLLYVVSTVFVCYLSFQKIIDAQTWNALFWIIILFACVNGSAKSFLQESRGRLLYYYTLASAQGIILSKIIYYAFLMVVISLAGYLLGSLLLGNPVRNPSIFITTLILGTIGISSAFTLISAIASKTGSGFTLMAVLGFPVIVPLLLAIMKASMLALMGIDFSPAVKYLLVILMMDVIVFTLACILFPYLWRD